MPVLALGSEKRESIEFSSRKVGWATVGSRTVHCDAGRAAMPAVILRVKGCSFRVGCKVKPLYRIAGVRLGFWETLLRRLCCVLDVLQSPKQHRTNFTFWNDLDENQIHQFWVIQ